MTEDKDVLGALLEKLEQSAQEQTVSVADVVDTTGPRSFAALMLVFALIAVSPASVVPGVTTGVALFEFILVTQMIAGRRHLWLPDVLARRRIAGEKLRAATRWLSRPVAFTDRLLRPRLSFLTEKPWIYPWLILILVLTLLMPFMEFVPGSGTLAASVIALIAAALLTRDGALLLLAGLCLGAFASLLLWLGGTLT